MKWQLIMEILRRNTIETRSAIQSHDYRMSKIIINQNPKTLSTWRDFWVSTVHKFGYKNVIIEISWFPLYIIARLLSLNGKTLALPQNFLRLAHKCLRARSTFLRLLCSNVCDGQFIVTVCIHSKVNKRLRVRMNRNTHAHTKWW